MKDYTPLSELMGLIQETIEFQFEGNEYWVSAQITNVKIQEHTRRCYLKLEEYANGRKLAEVRAVFWSNYYDEIEKFEKLTDQKFQSGLEIICRVKVRFHKVYGLNFDITKIDVAHTIGALELERRNTLARLVKENPDTIRLIDGVYYTFNKQLPLPLVIGNIALITPPNSDGQRDFINELENNVHGYTYAIDEYLCTIQGVKAHHLILQQLQLIAESDVQYDVVAIVRGGGSQSDFKPFEEYELARLIAGYQIPIFTGIGHDRNQSIVDMMAWEQKTPTKVASVIIDYNFDFENKLIYMRERISQLIEEQISDASNVLEQAKRIIRLASPKAILDRGFAIIMQDDKIITNPNKIKKDSVIQTILKDKVIHSNVIKKTKNEEQKK